MACPRGETCHVAQKGPRGAAEAVGGSAAGSCMNHQDFQGTARRILKNLGRGHVTPDYVCSWEPASAALGERSTLRQLSRGWRTPDPDSIGRRLDANVLIPILEHLEKMPAEEKKYEMTKSLTGATRSTRLDADEVLSSNSQISRSIATSSFRWWEPGETVIILDWDDTIFPTTWLSSKEAFRAWEADPSRRTSAPEEVGVSLSTSDQEELDYLDQAARSMLMKAAAVGRVGCVTLSVSPWQQQTMKRWLPLLAQVWEDLRIPVYYASQEKPKRGSGWNRGLAPARFRATSEEEEREFIQGQRASQKKHVMQKFIKQSCGASWKNIVSIGDGPAEFDAIMNLSFEHVNPLSAKTGMPKPFRVKTVGMLECPDCAALTLELQLLQAWLPGIVCSDDDLRIVVPESEDEILTMHEGFSN